MAVASSTIKQGLILTTFGVVLTLVGQTAYNSLVERFTFSKLEVVSTFIPMKLIGANQSAGLSGDYIVEALERCTIPQGALADFTDKRRLQYLEINRAWIVDYVKLVKQNPDGLQVTVITNASDKVVKDLRVKLESATGVQMALSDKEETVLVKDNAPSLASLDPGQSLIIYAWRTYPPSVFSGGGVTIIADGGTVPSTYITLKNNSLFEIVMAYLSGYAIIVFVLLALGVFMIFIIVMVAISQFNDGFRRWNYSKAMFDQNLSDVMALYSKYRPGEVNQLGTSAPMAFPAAPPAPSAAGSVPPSGSSAPPPK